MVDMPPVLPPEATSAGTAHDLLFPGDRRRPDRIEHVSQELLPLLRSDKIATIVAHDDDQDSLLAARGIVASLLLAAPFWLGIAGLLWWWFDD